MALTYNEGPFRNWTGVSFPGGAVGFVLVLVSASAGRAGLTTPCWTEFECSSTGTKDRALIVFTFPGTERPASFDALHATTATGRTSGATYDLSADTSKFCESGGKAAWETPGSPCPSTWQGMTSDAGGVAGVTINWNTPSTNPGFVAFEFVDFA